MSNRNLQTHWDYEGHVTATFAAPSVASRLLAASLIFLVDVYRRLVSPFLGPTCRFHPTCSRYAIEAIRLHGPLGGVCRAIARLARCNPLSAGGYDPVR